MNPNGFQQAILSQQNETRTAKVNIVTFLSYHLGFWEYHLNMRISDLFHLLLSKVQGSFCLWLPSTNITSTYHYTHIWTWVLETGTQILMLSWQTFYPLAHLFRPGIFFFLVFFFLTRTKTYAVVLTWYILEFTGKVLFIVGLSWLM